MPKHKNGKGQLAPYFVVTKSAPGHFFGIPADAGALIDALKLYNVSPAKQDQLQRIYLKRLTGPVNIFECRCGVKFMSEGYRANHIRVRHEAPKSNVKDFSECSEDERARILMDVGEPGLRPRDPEYYANQGDFHVPDPEDRQMAAIDRQLEQSIDWTQTAASKK